MYEFTFLIKNSYIFEKGYGDLLISDGKITRISGAGSLAPAEDAPPVGEKEPAGKKERLHIIDGTGMSLFPAFVDSHTHTDKAMTKERVPNASGTLSEAIGNMNRYFTGVGHEESVERSSDMVNRCIRRGTGYLRSHISIVPETELRGWDAALELRKKYRDYITIQLVAFPGAVEELKPGDRVYRLLERALASGADALGGCPNLSNDHRPFIDTLFDLAAAFMLPLDLHVDESEADQADALEYLAEATMRRGMEGRVTAGHCTALGSMDKDRAGDIINKVKDAGISIVTLPSCNLFLMGRSDPKNQRRGTTRIREFIEAGVNISLASDNIRDPFRPFGNGNLLEEALLTAQVAQMASPGEIDTLLQMITGNPARAVGLNSYGINEGAPANLVLIDSPDPASALIDQAPVRRVFHRGRPIFERDIDERHHLPGR